MLVLDTRDPPPPQAYEGVWTIDAGHFTTEAAPFRDCTKLETSLIFETVTLPMPDRVRDAVTEAVRAHFGSGVVDPASATRSKGAQIEDGTA